MASMTPTTGALGRQTIMTKPVPEVDQVHGKKTYFRLKIRVMFTRWTQYLSSKGRQSYRELIGL